MSAAAARTWTYRPTISRAAMRLQMQARHFTDRPLSRFHLQALPGRLRPAGLINKKTAGVHPGGCR
jgi:hypothetical protein